MIRWYPAAIRDPFPDAGTFIEYVPWRGVLHTTEGRDYDGARSVYVAKRVPPHFTAELELDSGTREGLGFHVWQHIPLDRAARALENPPGGVETNRARSIQIEVVASASKPSWPLELIAGVRDLMVWVEAQTGIRPWSPVYRGSEAYGLGGAARMSANDWKRFDGWCGHQHVPENRHWDPGPINSVMAALLARHNDTQAPVPPPAPVHDFEGDATKTMMMHIGPLDSNGCGHASWDPGLGRDPLVVAATLHGPYPPADGYWMQQADVTLAAQPRGGTVAVTVRNGKAGDTVTAWITVA